MKKIHQEKGIQKEPQESVTEGEYKKWPFLVEDTRMINHDECHLNKC